MSRSRGLLIFVVIMALAITAPASASQLSFVGTHNFITSLTHVESNEPISLRDGLIEANVQGKARYNPEEIFASFPDRNIVYGTPATLTAVIPVGAWLKTTKATISYDGDAGYTLSYNYVGYGPSPGGLGQPGYLSQWNFYPWHFSFYALYPAPEDGSYRADLQDTYNLTFSLVQGAGSAYPFTSVRGSLFVWFALSVFDSSHDVQHVTTILDLTYDTRPAAVPDFTVMENQILNISLTLDDIRAGDTLEVLGGVIAGQYGYTVVPVPPALGLALVALGRWLTRRRR